MFWLQISIPFRVFCVLALCVGCAASVGDPQPTSLCGGVASVSQVEGLTWLAGSPTQANVLCEVRGQRARIALSLEPESRDPLLFREPIQNRNLLLERFSGKQACPSRLTWFSSLGEKIGQRGDWPQNTYGVNLSKNESAFVTGFDGGVIQRVSWRTENFAEPLQPAASIEIPEGGKSNPIHTLNNDTWFAVIDNGYDLVRFQPKESKIFLFQDSSSPEKTQVFPVADETSGAKCMNAFQSVALSASDVLLSCNPQYFGPAASNRVAVFHVSLRSGGRIEVREIVHFDGAEIQRIDLWGLDSPKENLFVSYKNTAVNNYEGSIARSGWINLKTLVFKNESRFAGPLHLLGNSTGFVVACQKSLDRCSKGQFLFVEGAQPWRDEASLRVLELNPQLPFLSFPQEIYQP